MALTENPPLILIADDEVNTTFLLELILKREGYRIETVTSGLAVLERAKLQPDLILLDINMPGMNGFDVLLHLNENESTSRIPKIILTSRSREPADVTRGISLGVYDFLYKPFAPQELLMRVQDRLQTWQTEKAWELRSRELETSISALKQRKEQLETILNQEVAERLKTEQKSVFLSYRRSSGRHLARLVYDDLKSHGYDVFLDVETLNNGSFDQNILNHVARSAHFVLILSRGSLERCVNEDDWLRCEIEEAIRLERNIVPLFDEGFDQEIEKHYLPETTQIELFRKNGVSYFHSYPKSAFDALRERFLKSPDKVSLKPTIVSDLLDVQDRLERALKELRSD